MADYGDTGYRHEPRFEELDHAHDWKLENDDQDIRGRPLVSTTGFKIGVIDDLLIDKGRERVAAVRLKDGSMTAAENLEIHDDRVIWHSGGAGDRAVHMRGRSATR
ncbi:MAG: PRC-barrel domain-containing protein [Pacificimonas sp.]|jgi:hypothetical protein|nr:PRC-barrel domain-containing protein [Pacificimonas sp.]